MSANLGKIHNTGSRKIDLDVTVYYGGEAGRCIQLTGETEEGRAGYVQLNKNDILKLMSIAKEWIL